jgi:short-subunit dehydrogenase
MKIDKDTVAVVTGAASGIGRALAFRLAKEGATLALADIDESRLMTVSKLLTDSNVPHSIHGVDVSDVKYMEAFADRLLGRYGRVNLLINNAGVALHGTVEEISIADIEWIMGINFWGTVYGVKFFLPIMKAQKEAHIVNISSIFGIIAPPGQASYCASKFAVRGFTEALRHELKDTGVGISSVHPGGIRTNIAINARIGSNSDPTGRDEAAALFDRVARTTPEAAADRIVAGVKRGEERILIGRDAQIIDRIQRLIPVKYWRLFGRLLDKQTAKQEAQQVRQQM